VKKLLIVLFVLSACFGAVTNAAISNVNTTVGGTNLLNRMVGKSGNFLWATNAITTGSNFLTGKIDTASNFLTVKIDSASNYATTINNAESNFSLNAITNLSNFTYASVMGEQLYEYAPNGLFFPSRVLRANTALAMTSNVIQAIYFTQPITKTYTKIASFCTAVMTTQSAVTNMREVYMYVYEVTNIGVPGNPGYYTNFKLLGCSSNMASNFSTTANAWKISTFTNAGGIVFHQGDRYVIGICTFAQPTLAVFPSVACTTGGGNIAFMTASFPPQGGSSGLANHAAAGALETPSTIGNLTTPFYWLQE
jgi:hypothetical protein